MGARREPAVRPAPASRCAGGNARRRRYGSGSRRARGPRSGQAAFSRSLASGGPEPLAIVALARHLEPVLVAQVPADRVLEPRGEIEARLPAELRADLGGVDRIAPVMSRPVRDEANEVAARAERGGSADAVDRVADEPN